MSINMYNMLIFRIYILFKGVIDMSSLRFEESRLSARELTLAAAMTAVVFLLTFVPKIPIPLGYAHLGDAGIFLIICLVGKREGVLAGCLGSMLADFLGGFALWMGPTLLIKWAMAMTFIKVSREGELGSLRSLRTYAALIAACLVMAVAYALFGALLYDSLAAGLASLPGLLLEGAVNILAFCAAAVPLGKHMGRAKSFSSH